MKNELRNGTTNDKEFNRAAFRQSWPRCNGSTISGTAGLFYFMIVPVVFVNGLVTLAREQNWLQGGAYKATTRDESQERVCRVFPSISFKWLATYRTDGRCDGEARKRRSAPVEMFVKSRSRNPFVRANRTMLFTQVSPIEIVLN